MTGISRRSLLAAAAGLPCSAALAQSSPAVFPSRPITIVVPFPPGGATDLMARTIAQRFTSAWGQPVTIDNKPGAGGMLAAAHIEARMAAAVCRDVDKNTLIISRRYMSVQYVGSVLAVCK